MKQNVTIILLTLFLSLWLWTEFTEAVDRSHFYEQVSEFIGKGERFTAVDGAKLEARVKKLEEQANE